MIRFPGSLTRENWASKEIANIMRTMISVLFCLRSNDFSISAGGAMFPGSLTRENWASDENANIMRTMVSVFFVSSEQ